MAKRYHWYIGPWEFAESPWPHWKPPEGAIGSLDVRSLPQQAKRDGTPGLGIFVTDGVRLGSDYESLGTGAHRDIKTSQRLKDRIPSIRNRQPQGDDLLGLLLDLLTDGSDPTGDDGPKPLIPNTRGQVDLSIAGLRHSERMRSGQRYWGKVLDVIRSDTEGEIKSSQHHRRILDALCDKYGTDDWEQFVHPARRREIPGRLKHETTFTESFDTGDSATLGPDLSWTELESGWDVVSNAAQANTLTNHNTARADADLSSVDHYAQGVLLNTTGDFRGVLCRKDSSATMTYYHFDRYDPSGTYRIWKRIAGAFTNLANGSVAFANNDVLKGECNGSAIALYRNGVSATSTTDTSITAGVRCGLVAWGTATQARIDSFECSDNLSGGIVYTQLERNTRGLHRGVYTGF